MSELKRKDHEKLSVSSVVVAYKHDTDVEACGHTLQFFITNTTARAVDGPVECKTFL
jgi:hypothetical protein